MPSSLRPTPATWSEARQRLAGDRTRHLARLRKQALRRPAFPPRLRRQVTRRRLVAAWTLAAVAHVAAGWIAPESLLSLLTSAVSILALGAFWFLSWRVGSATSPVELLDERQLRQRLAVEAWSWRILVAVVFGLGMVAWVWAVAGADAPPHDGVRALVTALFLWACVLPAAVEAWLTPDLDEEQEAADA